MYQITSNTLTAETYQTLTEKVNWRPYPKPQIEKALLNSLYTICVYDDNKPIAMTRLIGDMSMSYLIKDVVVDPAYQRQGIGKKMIHHLFQYIKQNSIPGTKVTVEVMSAPDKEPFYQQLGFQKRPNLYAGSGLTTTLVINQS